MTKLKKHVLLAGLTAAKQMIVLRWKPPRSLTIKHWLLTTLDVIYLEMSTARINGASEECLNTQRAAPDPLKDLLG